jgi:hypothetical protein
MIPEKKYFHVFDFEDMKKAFYITRIKSQGDNIVINGETNRMAFDITLAKFHSTLHFQSGYIQSIKIGHGKDSYIFELGAWKEAVPPPDVLNLASKLSKLM